MLEYLRYKGACHDSQTDLLDAPLVYNWPNVRMHTKRFTAEIATNRCKMWGNINQTSVTVLHVLHHYKCQCKRYNRHKNIVFFCTWAMFCFTITSSHLHH